VIVNAANEVAIERFVAGSISFGALSRVILESYSRFSHTPNSLEEVFALDAEVRAYARSIVC
jgi:1-deoxy-D-xylulose 5-phosphate reductoisomerase